MKYKFYQLIEDYDFVQGYVNASNVLYLNDDLKTGDKIVLSFDGLDKKFSLTVYRMKEKEVFVIVEVLNGVDTNYTKWLKGMNMTNREMLIFFIILIESRKRQDAIDMLNRKEEIKLEIMS